MHFYQPADQQPDILEEVVVESYRPILKGLKEHKKARVTFNVNGSLLELFDKYKYRDVIDSLRTLGREGRIEFTGSAKYHAILPFLDDKEIVRQIEANNETMKFFLEDAYCPKGFFPPEMAYSEKLAPMIEKLGFKWIVLDEIAINGKAGQVDYENFYKIKGGNLYVFFRERRLSNLIMSAIVRTGESLIEAMEKEKNAHRYILTGMDGETFGHHRPGLEKILFEIFDSPKFNLITISELLKEQRKTEEISPVKSTWASSEEDIEKGVQFLSWSDPDNEIHVWQWELVHLALDEVLAMPKKDPLYQKIRERMDAALASDHFWWASAKPWWSLEMIEAGAHRLLSITRDTPGVSEEKLTRAGKLYEKIVSTAFEWKRTGKILEMMRGQKNLIRIPFKERTLEKGGREAEIYRAFMDMIKGLEEKAAKNREYEKAVLWRDAIYKLENKHDIYDTIHAIDLLRLEIPQEEVERTLDKYTEKYRKIRGGQPEQRGA